MTKLITFFLLFLFSVGNSCTSTKKGESLSSENYFPVGAFEVKVPTGFTSQEKFEQKMDSIKRANYIGEFSKMSEESIYLNCSSEKHSYRFTWIPSFHTPFSIKGTEKENSADLILKHKSRANEKTKRTSYDSLSFGLSKREWDQVLEHLQEINFWNLKTINKKYKILNDSTLIISPPGNDGANWIIEGCSNGNYHIVDRWSGEVNTDYKKNFTYLLQITDMDSISTLLY